MTPSSSYSSRSSLTTSPSFVGFVERLQQPRWIRSTASLIQCLIILVVVSPQNYYESHHRNHFGVVLASAASVVVEATVAAAVADGGFVVTAVDEIDDDSNNNIDNKQTVSEIVSNLVVPNTNKLLHNENISTTTATTTTTSDAASDDATITTATTNTSTHLSQYEHRWKGCDDFERVWTEYHNIDHYKGVYQAVDIYYNEEFDDTCLFLQEYLHACASNRPQYHEPFVHYPTRFLTQRPLERVLFIGGGDSMVLHEVLKYPNIQLVVGLELDQAVVRTSFQFFGTQPHWDDDRVEWYFGDAANSLSLLPREYYGSFDLVVVDILSPVAQALRVNDELTVMEASMLLLKPDGIIVKNEDEGYTPGRNSANFTKYSVDIMYHDVPLYCLQTFVIGSNSRSFLDVTPKDHGVETLYMKDIDEFQSQFDSYYNTNDEDLLGSRCAQLAAASADDTVAATTSERPVVGVNMIIEAESVNFADNNKIIQTESDIISVFRPILVNDFGFSILHEERTTLYDEWDSINTVTFVFDQGYVVVRCVAALQYYGFDVQLWADIHKLPEMKTALLSAVGSNDHASEFRIATGGMVGATDEHSHLIGPPSMREYCNSEERFSQPETSTSDEVSTQPSSPTVTLASTPLEEKEFNNMTLSSYDHTSARLQWKSQRSIALQTIQQYNLTIEDGDKKKYQVMKIIGEVLVDVLMNSGFAGELKEAPKIQSLESFSGKGSVALASWASGNVVIVWNGEGRFDLNWFIFGIDTDIEDNLMAAYENTLKFYLPSKAVARDEVSRGTGRVINFYGDYQDRDEDSTVW